MAKVTFSKLGLKSREDIKTITINDCEIEVKQYLPISEKINIVTNVLVNSAEGNFSNPMKVEVFFNMEIIYNYTNITFTDKQKEDITKLYDLLEESDIFNEILSAIPEKEYKTLLDWTTEIIDSYYKYRNSALGIMDTISTDYKDLEMDTEKIQKDIADPENLKLLKSVMNKLG